MKHARWGVKMLQMNCHLPLPSGSRATGFQLQGCQHFSWYHPILLPRAVRVLPASRGKHGCWGCSWSCRAPQRIPITANKSHKHAVYRERKNLKETKYYGHLKCLTGFMLTPSGGCSWPVSHFQRSGFSFICKTTYSFRNIKQQKRPSLFQSSDQAIIQKSYVKQYVKASLQAYHLLVTLIWT